MMVKDIARLHPGAMMSLKPNAAMEIAIRANGRLFGTGELVQVGEQLAIEIKTLLSASPERCRGK